MCSRLNLTPISSENLHQYSTIVISPDYFPMLFMVNKNKNYFIFIRSSRSSRLTRMTHLYLMQNLCIVVVSLRYVGRLASRAYGTLIRRVRDAKALY